MKSSLLGKISFVLSRTVQNDRWDARSRTFRITAVYDMVNSLHSWGCSVSLVQSCTTPCATSPWRRWCPIFVGPQHSCTLLQRRILSRLVDFWKICRPLHYWQLISNKTCTVLYECWVLLFQYKPTAISCERTLRDCECRTELSALQRECVEKMGYLLFPSEVQYKKYYVILPVSDLEIYKRRQAEFPLQFPSFLVKVPWCTRLRKVLWYKRREVPFYTRLRWEVPRYTRLSRKTPWSQELRTY
jgi:hypothetical protein